MTEMYSMFFDAQAFDQDISGWDVSSATNTSYMFTYAFAFNRPLNSWNVSNVTNMQYMFFDAQAFDQDISGWVVDQVTSFQNFRSGSSLSTPNTPLRFVNAGQ
jgi:surface protein